MTDFTKAVKQEVDANKKKLTRDAMDIWFTASQERLVEAAQQRAGGEGADDSEGMVGREENNLSDMLDEFQPPQWDATENAWVFTWAHAAASLHEWGAEPHEIRARKAQALAFEWPDAPEEIQERFEDTFPTVFFDSVEHPGVPAIAPIRYGREKARKRLEGAGVSVKEFGERGGP